MPELQRGATSTSVIDVLDHILDKGVVIDAWVRVSVAGIDLIRREFGSDQAFGITSPLVKAASGKKIGKTEKGAVWLTADRDAISAAVAGHAFARDVYQRR